MRQGASDEARARWSFLLALALVRVAARRTSAAPTSSTRARPAPIALLVTVRPPEVDARASPRSTCARCRPASSKMTMVPLPAQGDRRRACRRRPTSPRAIEDDPQTFVGHLWLMQAGAWQVRAARRRRARSGRARRAGAGAAGADARRCRRCSASACSRCLRLLAFGAVSIAGAGARDAQLARRREPSTRERRRGTRRA